MIIMGKCHCGNISFSLVWEGESEIIPVRACGCSFCVKHGGVWTSLPGSALEVVVGDGSLVSRYTFGTQTAEFHVCRRCGVVPVATSSIGDRLYAVVNANTFENIEPSRLSRTATDFDGERTDARLARRQRNWIGDVRVVESTT